MGLPNGKGIQTKSALDSALDKAPDELPIIVGVKTGLVSWDNAIFTRVPGEYAAGTIEEVLKYVTDVEFLKQSETSLAQSIRNELGARGSIVVVNKKKANLADRVYDYLIKKEHKLRNGVLMSYRGLDIEVSAVQQGGYSPKWVL